MTFDVKAAREAMTSDKEKGKIDPLVIYCYLAAACHRVEALEKDNAALRAEVDLDRVAKLLADNVLLGEAVTVARAILDNNNGDVTFECYCGVGRCRVCTDLKKWKQAKAALAPAVEKL